MRNVILSMSALLRLSAVTLPLGAAAAAVAQKVGLEEHRPRIPPFSSLCVEEEKTGFNWERGDWVLSRFKLSKYIDRKYSFDYVDRLPERGGLQFFNCDPAFRTSENRRASDSTYSFVQACYSVREMGDSSRDERTSLCDEFWKKSNTGAWELKSINCPEEQFALRPDGQFLRHSIGTDLASASELVELGKKTSETWDDIAGGYKDSITASHGTCAQVTSGKN